MITDQETAREMILSKYWASKLNLSGKGGLEKKLAKVFKRSKRQNAPLFDIIDAAGDFRELKKQANVQWFDVGKYHALRTEDREILMTFVMHKEGKLQVIFDIKLGEFLDLMCSNDKYRKWGWTKENFENQHNIKTLYPTSQGKFKAAMKTVFNENEGKFRTLWERSD